MEPLCDVGHVESHFGLFGCKTGAWFVPNVPKAQKSFWTHPILLLCDEAHQEAHFGLFRDNVNLDAKSMHGFGRTFRRLINHFGHTSWNS
jgi:hypothetical protein